MSVGLGPETLEMRAPAGAAIQIVRLGRETLEQHLEALLALDDESRDALGDIYAEHWGVAAFRAEPPEKWDWSLVALEPSRGPVGFWIASRRTPAVVWTHRATVARAARRQGVAAAMLAVLRAQAREAGVGSLALAVHERNVAAQAFYRTMGFRPLPAALRLRLAGALPADRSVWSAPVEVETP